MVTAVGDRASGAGWRPFSVKVEGALLSGETRGDLALRPPLWLIHGMAGSRADWDALVAQLPPDLPIVRHDLRGFGQSSAKPGVAFSHADDLLAMADALGLDRFVPLGLSMGGGVAVHFALDHPARVAAMALISPAMVGWDWSDDWKAQWRGVSKAARSGDMAMARELWFQHPMFAQLRKGPHASAFRAEIEAYHGTQWTGSDERAELPDIDRLPALAPPTLLLSGSRDVPDMRLIADVIAGAAPCVTRVDFPEAGHMLHLERTAEVAHAVVAHLS